MATLADAAVVIVDKNGLETPYASLTQAVAAVDSHQIILVGPGNHLVTPGYTPGAHGTSFAPMQIRAKTNVSLIGSSKQSVVLHGEGPGDFLWIRDSHHIEIRNLTFLGNRPPIVSNQLFSTINFSGTNTNIRITDCRFIRQGNHSISHLWGDKSTRGVQISDCIFLEGGDLFGRGGDTDGAAVSGIGCDWLIVNNRIERYVRGIEVEGCGPSIVENITISGNHLREVDNLGISIIPSCGTGDAFRNIVITDNHLVDAWSDEAVNGVPIFVGGGRNITIANNMVRRAKAAGIYVSTTHADIRNCILANNQVRDCGWRGIQVYAQGTRLVENILVSGNHVADCKDSGILVRGSNITLAHNMVQNNSQGGGHLGAGIEIHAGSSRTFIDANRCWDSNAIRRQEHGVWIRSGATETTVRDNWLADNLSDGLRADTDDVLAEGNRGVEAEPETLVEINTAGGDIALTWPRSSKSYEVQEAANELPLAWSNTHQAVSILDDDYFTILPSAYEGKLYRLMGQ